MTATVIQLKKSATPSAQPGSLANGELAINYADGKLFYKDSLGAIQQISSGSNSYSTINVAGSLIVADMGSDILTINKGDNIDLSTDVINDAFTITANLKPAFDMANLAWELANTANSKSGGGSASVSTSDSAPLSPVDGDLWWNSLIGKLFVYYDDSSSSQWVEASGGLLYSAESIATSAWNTANAAFGKANTALANTSGAVFSGNLIITETVTVGSSQLKNFILTTSTTDSQILDNFTVASFRSAHYNITVNSGIKFETTQVSLVHNDSDSFITEYGLIYTDEVLATFNTSIVSGQVRLNVTPTNATSTVKVLRTTIT